MFTEKYGCLREKCSLPTLSIKEPAALKSDRKKRENLSPFWWEIRIAC